MNGGHSCGRTFRAGNHTTFKELYVMADPATIGAVSVRQGGYWRYTPPPGFRGRDQFMLRVCGEERGQPGCAKLHVLVTVN